MSFQVMAHAHFKMPNNICNIFFYPMASSKRIEKYKNDARAKIDRISDDIRQGKIRKKGFNVISKYLGLLTQRIYFRRAMTNAQKSVRVSSSCNMCLRCVQACPVNNLKAESGQIAHNEKCILCFRCVNLCPQKAITVLHHGKIKKQYHGPE